MIRAIIVEDEIIGQELLKFNLKEVFPECEIAAVADSVDTAVEVIKEHKPHLVFLDVQIKGGTGFDVLNKFNNPPFEVIFVTAYNNFAIDAIKKRAFDYLLKPLNKREFADCVKRVRETLSESVIEKDEGFINQSLAVKTTSGTEYVKFKTILFFEAEGAYTRIQFFTHSVLSAKNIGEYEALLSTSGFFRCHHSYLVNTQHIEKFNKGRNGVITLSNGHLVPVSQRKIKSFVTVLHSLKKEVDV